MHNGLTVRLAIPRIVVQAERRSPARALIEAITLGRMSILISLLLTMAESDPQLEYRSSILMRQILLLFARR